MIQRSSSSRRRRASRSAASSPHSVGRSPGRPGSCSASTSPARRASIAVSPVDGDRNSLYPEIAINKSPRHSIIPDIAFDNKEFSCDELPPKVRSPRGSLVPDSALSPRNSLVPDFNRSPRSSLVPGDTYTSRSARNSLVPDSALSPRNSLAPDFYNRSPRNSLTPDAFNRSPRNSLVPESTTSIRSPRHSLVPSESATWNQRSPSGAHDDVTISVGRKYSLATPRGSVCPETIQLRTSPRGSVAGDLLEDALCKRERSPRGSLGSNRLLAETSELGSSKTPRGSLTLTFQEPPTSERRSSADNPASSNRRYPGRSSPYPSRSSQHNNYNSTASVCVESSSRRASSSVSQVNLTQVSGDEQRRLCYEQNRYDGCDAEMGGLRLGGINRLTTYGSVAYQLRDANTEASSTCDFVCKALRIINKMLAVTFLFIAMFAITVIMLIMGLQFLKDCPREPRIPIYMVIGGGVGCIKITCLLYGQLHKPSQLDSSSAAPSILWRILSLVLTVFLLVWFGLGNYWILRIKWPDYSPEMYDPNKWCHQTLYEFGVVHLFVVYGVLGAFVLLVVTLACSQVVGCPWLDPAR